MSNNVWDLFSIEGQVALVTGAARNLGRDMAEALAEAGADVAITSRSLERANETAATITEATGRTIRGYQLDLSEEEQIIRTIAQVIEDFGKLDILVNNAGNVRSSAPPEARSLADWNYTFALNSTGVFLCTREAARVMIEKKTEGRIVNISSIHATLSEPSACAYTAAKGGMEAFARTCATELAPHKIRVNTIQPGATYTELTIPMYTEAVKKALFERIPLKEIAEAEWIANGAVFLASDESRYMTGQVIVIDGGYVMDGSLPGAAYWEK